MTTWHGYLKEEGRPPSWPYPIMFEQEQEIDTDVLVIGGGIAGCWAAISAARQGLRVALVEKSDTVRSGSGGPGCDHWCDVPANPLSRVTPDDWAKHMADTGKFEHSKIGDLLGRWSKVAENIATGYSVGSMFNGLKNSPLHYDNMVSTRYTHFGVGVYVDSDGVIWTTHVFAS